MIGRVAWSGIDDSASRAPVHMVGRRPARRACAGGESETSVREFISPAALAIRRPNACWPLARRSPWDIDGEALEAAGRTLAVKGKVTTEQVELTVEASVDPATQSVVENHGKIDIRSTMPA